MAIINLRDYYPFYTSDCFMEVSEEVAEMFKEFDRKEAAYRLRTYRHKAYYSLDRDDGLEHEAVFVALSPHELYERKVTMQEFHAAIAIEPPVQENPEPDIPADPAISVEARNAYGYTDDAMLPLTKERAMELFERDVPVYLLYGDNTEAMAFEKTEILNHGGIFGIDRADWEAVKEQFPVITENRWQKAFQQNPADSYCIYQLRKDPELAELRFMNSHYLREHGIEPAFDHYEAVYSGLLPSDGSTESRLDDLYMKFNTTHPQDFTGHSLSVSDIVVLRQQGAVSSHYVDSVGFVQLPAFLPDNYLKNAEMSMEDDYGMIDGIINNGPKEQPEIKPKAPSLAALFETARQVVQEDKQAPEPSKKPSVLAMLPAPAPSRNEKSAQTKSAERDLI